MNYRTTENYSSPKIGLRVSFLLLMKAWAMSLQFSCIRRSWWTWQTMTWFNRFCDVCNQCCALQTMSTPKKVRGTKHRASPPLQKVGEHVPLSTHGSTPLAGQAVSSLYGSFVTVLAGSEFQLSSQNFQNRRSAVVQSCQYIGAKHQWCSPRGWPIFMALALAMVWKFQALALLSELHWDIFGIIFKRKKDNKISPLIATLKPQSNGTSYSNTVIGTLAVDGWDVTFGTTRRGMGGALARPSPSSLYQM